MSNTNPGATSQQELQGQPPQPVQQMQQIPSQIQGISSYNNNAMYSNNSYAPMQQQQQQQQQQIGFTVQGVAPMQQQQQQQGQPPQPVQQMQQIPCQIQGTSSYNNNAMFLNNSNAPMQQQQQQIGYTVQGSAPMQQQQPPQAGFRLIKFPASPDKSTETTATKLKLAAIIITMCDGSSYDGLFSSVKQDAGEGSRVAVYACAAGDMQDLITHLNQTDKDTSTRKDDLPLLLQDLREIEDASCVAVNYECCSGCSDTGFKVDAKIVIEQFVSLLQRGYLIMCSDFSVKALFTAWSAVGDETPLGPNPLMRTGDHSSSITLHFNPYTLKTCISSQLQAVGELCPDQDYCTVHCMGGTVRYSLKEAYRSPSAAMKKTPYNVEVLTIAQFPTTAHSVSIEVPDFSLLKKKKKGEEDTGTDADMDIEATKLPMKTLKGDAGHVVLDYAVMGKGKEEEKEQGEVEIKAKGKGGLKGRILLSMTHWCELVKLGDSVQDEVLFKVAAKNLGAGSKAYQSMQAQYASMGGINAQGAQLVQQKQWITQQANLMVQQQAPCNNAMNSNYK